MRDFYLIERDLQKVTEGDLSALDKLNKLSNDQLIATEQNSPKLTLKTEAIIRVLRYLLEERVSPLLVQKWASFMKRGYLPIRQ